MWVIVDYEQGGITVCCGQTEDDAWANLPGGINGCGLEALQVEDDDLEDDEE